MPADLSDLARMESLMQDYEGMGFLICGDFNACPHRGGAFWEELQTLTVRNYLDAEDVNNCLQILLHSFLQLMVPLVGSTIFYVQNIFAIN